jgi:hypothetical protein
MVRIKSTAAIRLLFYKITAINKISCMKKTFFPPRTKQHLKCFAIFCLFILPFSTLLFIVNSAGVFLLLNLFMGLFCWTYFEYHLHRFWTHTEHGETKTQLVKSHLHHHHHPTEIKVTAVHRTILSAGCLVLLFLAIRWNNYFSIAAGFFIGFSYSFFSHWMLHQPWSKKIMPRLHKFHIHHHCKYPNRCFGFTTPLWDHIFGTTPPRGVIISDRVIQFYYGD